MTAFILRNVSQIPLSYQTVLNYCQAAAAYLHRLNLAYTGPSDILCADDEVLLKINSDRAYTFLFIGAESHKTTRPHSSLSGNRPVHLDQLDTIPTLQARWCKLPDLAIALPQAA
jgi:hypothetical protein